MNRITTPLLAAALTLLAGCNGSDQDAAAGTNTGTGHSTPPAAWILTSAPEGAVSVSEAKANAKEGDLISIHGRIGGRVDPMSPDSPVFTIVDLQLEYCGQHTDDACTTPWDYCCETPETIGSNTATVQLVSDSDINPTTSLEPLDEVILQGTVGPRPNERVLTIRATGVYPIEG